MALAPGSPFGPYEIVSTLGQGGMGEVYEARDPRLNRLVALKRLPAGATADPERRERFEREAQMVAALNHPHIVTIYSVEQADGQFFLTMELVEGRSLADAMPRSGLPLDRLLKIAIPVADAMAAAHHKGITHRDLKPGNIMLGEGEQDGRVKVLDFGLAKLSEAPLAAVGLTALPTAPITGEGRILGTVAYMSPEQAEGKPIDARSDLFSLGVILYEMATGVRPFTGDTSLSIISSILKDTPKPITDLNPGLPRDLGRIIRRALSKDLDHRYQTAKDLRNDLEDLKTSIDSGELQTPGVGRPVERRRGPAIVAAAVLAAAAVAVAGNYLFTSRPAQPLVSAPAAALPALEIVQLTTSGNAARPAISPDGKYVAYVQRTEVPGPGGAVVSADSVWIRQIATSSNVQIVAPEPGGAILGLTVKPDGNYVDYLRRLVGRLSLWRVSFLGGRPTKLLDDVYTPIGWSPDGRQMAFVRSHAGRGATELVVAEDDGGNARVLTTRQIPARFDSLSLLAQPGARPAWSLDGRVIAVLGGLQSGSQERQVVFVNTNTGTEQSVPLRGAVPFFPAYGLDWLDPDSLVLNQVESSGLSQLWRLEYPGGAVTRLTNDLTDYMDVNMTAARDSLVTTKTDLRVAIWVSDGAGANGKEVVPPLQSSGTLQNVTWAADRLLFTGMSGGHRAILSVGPDGRPQELVRQAFFPTTTSDGRTVVFISTDPARRGLWKTTDGGRLVRLTDMAPGWPIVTGDDRSVVFTSASGGGTQSLWTVSIDGGTPTPLWKRFAAGLRLSLDGKSLTFNSGEGQDRRVTVFCDLPDCSSPKLVPLPAGGAPGGTVGRQWRADMGIPYVTGSPANVWVQMPGGKESPRRITNFTDDRQILDVAWSRDGARLAVARATQTRDIVLIKGLKK